MKEFDRLKNEIEAVRDEIFRLADETAITYRETPDKSNLPQIWKESKNKISQLRQKEKQLSARLNDIYMDDLKEGGNAAIYADAARLLNDFLDYVFFDLSKTIMMQKEEPSGIILIGITGYSIDRFSDHFAEIVNDQRNGAFRPAASSIRLEEEQTKKFITASLLSRHLEALKGSQEEKDLRKLIRNTVKSSAYVERIRQDNQSYSAVLLNNKNTLPVYHGESFDRIAKVSRRIMSEEPGTDNLRYESPDRNFSMTISDISKISKNISVRTHALLSIALCIFTAENNNLPKPKKGIKPEYESYTVRFLADDYIRLMGYDITEHIMGNPEDQAKESARVEHVRAEARRDIKQDLELLHGITVRTKERRRRMMYTITPTTGLEGKYISITFNPDIIEYLAMLPKTQYPLWLPRLSGRYSNAYRIGNKLMTHYSMKQNHNFETQNRLKVKTLLSATDLPTYEDLEKETYSGRNETRKWRHRIKEYFETALNQLLTLEDGGLESWHYERTGSGMITQEEADSIADFKEYSELLIVFFPVNPPEYAELGRRKENIQNV